jgi:polysaccharide export outer membrane protein
MKKPLGVLASVMVFAISAVAQYTPGSVVAGSVSPSDIAGSPTAVPKLQQHDSRYRLRKSDSFEIDFTFSPEFNETVTVQPDGFATLKEVGTIQVEGKTVPELTQTIKEAYAKILHDPVLVIVLRDFERPFFIASGQVAKPGKYDLRGPITLTEGVAIAGGFNDSAKHSQVVLFHPTPDGVFEAKLLNVKQLLASRDLREDLYLQPGDMVYVPQNRISKIRKFLPSTSVGAYYNPTTY